MTRMKPDDRRLAIIDAATEVATKKGLSATTVRDVAVEMGTSSGLIHHYFDSMDQLLSEVFVKVAEADISRTRAKMDRSNTATGKLAEYFAAFTDPDNDEAFQFWLDAWSEATRNETIRKASRAQNIEWQQLLAAVIEAGIQDGEFTEVDIDAVSWKALSLLDGLELQIVAHPTVLNRGEAARWAAESIEKELGLPAGEMRRSLSTV